MFASRLSLLKNPAKSPLYSGSFGGRKNSFVTSSSLLRQNGLLPKKHTVKTFLSSPLDTVSLYHSGRMISSPPTNVFSNKSALTKRLIATKSNVNIKKITPETSTKTSWFSNLWENKFILLKRLIVGSAVGFAGYATYSLHHDKADLQKAAYMMELDITNSTVEQDLAYLVPNPMPDDRINNLTWLDIGRIFFNAYRSNVRRYITGGKGIEAELLDLEEVAFPRLKEEISKELNKDSFKQGDITVALKVVHYRSSNLAKVQYLIRGGGGFGSGGGNKVNTIDGYSTSVAYHMKIDQAGLKDAISGNNGDDGECLVRLFKFWYRFFEYNHDNHDKRSDRSITFSSWSKNDDTVVLGIINFLQAESESKED